VPLKQIRLREKTSNGLGRIYRDNKLIKEQLIIDNREIAIELLEHEESLGTKEL